jgi:uncharacterized repeat protein (TIGR03803 family)
MLRIRGLAPLTVVTAVLIFGTSRFALAGAQPATEKILHSFNPQPTDGYYPYANLISDAAGNLYGTTSAGGTNGAGSVFELSPRKAGSWKETVLYSFNYSGSDGYKPERAWSSIHTEISTARPQLGALMGARGPPTGVGRCLNCRLRDAEAG